MSNDTSSRKRRRESYNVDVRQVEIYEDLASEKDKVRLKAAHELVSRFTPESNPTEEQIKKTLQRLFRGLCSGRKAARIGFSIALTEVLAQVFGSKQPAAGLNVSDAVQIFLSVTSVSGSSTQEQRDTYLGALFGAEAIIKSGILFQPEVPSQEWDRIVATLVDLGKAKPWLREECGWILWRALYDLSSRNADVKYSESLIEIISSKDLVKSPEGVAIWLLVQDSFPGAKLPQELWKYNNDPLDRRDMGTLAKIMKQASEAEEGVQSSVWNSKLHFAWDAILKRVHDGKPGEDKKDKKDKKKRKESRITFGDFWKEVVDNGLFAAASSEERKYWGFSLFMKILDEAPIQRAETIFTKNIIRCLINQLSVEDRYLHRMAVKAAKTIQKRVANEPEFAAAAVNGLLGPSGSFQFDQITKTKTVEKIVIDAGPQSLKKIVQLLERLVAVPGTDEIKAASAGRQYIADLFVSVARSRSSAGEEFTPILQDILSVLVRFAYFSGQQENQELVAEPPLTQATQELFRNRINSCLNSLITNTKDPAEVAYAVVRQIRDYQKSEECGKFIIEIDGTIAESVDAAFKSLKKLSSKVKHDDGDSKDDSVHAFRLVYSLTILQVYNGDADAVSMLDELAFCYSKFWGDKKSKKEDRSDASNALVEILLSFASKPSKLFRRMSEQVFGVFANQITADGLQSLISVVEVKENLAGQREMFDQQDDEDEEMEDAGSLDSDDDSVEIIDADDAEGSDGGSDDDEDEDDEEDEEDEEELAAFDAKLAEALGTHRADQELGDESGDHSDEDMNDDEMEAVDEMLVKVFKARRQATTKKKDKQDAKETMTNFKNRVLDLLDIYVKKCHSSILALDLVLPLLRLTRKSAVKQISQKAGDVLREYTRLCKGNAISTLVSELGEDEDEGEDEDNDDDDDEKTDNTIEQVWDLLRAVHKEAMISGPAAHASSASQASVFLVKVLVAHDKQNIAGIVDIYAETRKAQMLSNKCHVQPSFFTDWNNWCVNAGKSMKN